MSMASMLGKMVVAGLVAKGVGKMMGGNSNSSGGGLGGALAGMLGGSGGAAGGLASMLGGGAASGGLGAILGSLAGNMTGGSAGDSRQQSNNGGIADILGSFMGEQPDTSALQVTDEQNKQAEILLKAMLNAAKSDGQIDKAEQEKIIAHLGDVSDDEAAFVREEMSSPLDTAAFIRSVPRGMEQQVYLMSLSAIDLDSQAEAKYLHELAQNMGISKEQCNNIHDQVGAPKLYS